MAFTSNIAAAILAFAAIASAQNPGPVTPEVHPKLSTQKCTTAGGCVAQDTSVVLDYNYRWLHTADGYDPCSATNKTLCADEASCAKNCVVEGVDYSTYGVSTSGSSLNMSQFVPSATGPQSVSPRVYLLDESAGDYVMLKLLGQELTFDVDLSTLPCGENGALYLSEMDKSGGRNQYQTGGANYGGGYCDAQCPVQNWTNGTLNTAGTGYCCNEMDILESNSLAAGMTPHPCNEGDTDCDKGGCGFNSYSRGFPNYWAPGGTLDTSRPFTVTTQFHTSDGTASGVLTSIERIYHQDGKQLPPAVSGGDIITDSWCKSVDASAATFGSLKTMGEALGRGMVLIFSIWNDNGQFMNWLDSGSAGPCSATAGNPANILANNSGTHVVFSNIKWGDIGSTNGKAPVSSSSAMTMSMPMSMSMPMPSSSAVKPTTTAVTTTAAATTTKPVMTTAKPTTAKTTTTTTSTTTKKPATTTAAAGPMQGQWGQCGGIGWSGMTACKSPWKCTKLNDYYYQCL